MKTEDPLTIAPLEIPEDVRDGWLERGWPEGLLDRAYALRVRRADIDRWLRRGRHAVKRIQRDLDRRAQLIAGTMRVREATWEDDEALADLYANAPEKVGEWEVTVERSPYPFAQFRLQENVSIRVLDDRGAALAAVVHSARNTVVGGKKIAVQIESAWRARSDARGEGLGHLLRQAPRRAFSWSPAATYYYRRHRSRRGRTATVKCFQSRPYDGDTAGIRLARRSDIRRCVSLVNGTHSGLDLFRPYGVEYLQSKLDDPCWGPKPDGWVPVYGWQDYHVVEEEGTIVACAGLWDRGEHMREVWRHRTSGERRVVEPTALMDFGYAEGGEAAMARLIGYLIGVSHRLGRDHLMAPLEYLPSLQEALAEYGPTDETRPIYWQAPKSMGVELSRPYTDLAYW